MVGILRDHYGSLHFTIPIILKANWYHGPLVGLALDHVMGLPVLRLSSSCMHAVATTPTELQALFARSPVANGLPRKLGGSASTLNFSRPAQRLLTFRPACSPSSLKNPLHQRLQPFRHLHSCSSCYRPERQLPGGIRTR